MSWKNRDTWNLHDGRPGGNNRSITAGGYKEYSDALRAEQRRLRSEYRRTPEVEALNGEINYICGMYVPAFEGDEAIDTIAERYGLHYNTGRLSRQFGTVLKRIHRLALPGRRRANSAPV